jgi:hypothetical protein
MDALTRFFLVAIRTHDSIKQRIDEIDPSPFFQQCGDICSITRAPYQP